MELAELVKYKRRYFSHKQPELAKKAGVGIHFIRDLEQGKKSLRMDKVNQVLAVYEFELAPIAIYFNRKTTTQYLPRKYKDLHPWI